MCLDSFYVFQVIYVSNMGVQMAPPPAPVPPRLTTVEVQTKISLTSVIFRPVTFYGTEIFKFLNVKFLT